MVISGSETLHSGKQAVIEQALRQGRTYKEIASQYRVSFRDISRVAREMHEPSPFDVFDMVVRGKTPREIAEQTGAEFDEVKRVYEESVDLLELVNRHSKALKELRGTELYEKLMENGEDKTDYQKVVISVKYVCARCGEPLIGAPNLERCPKCGHTKYRKMW